MALFCTGYHIYLSYRTKNSSHNRGCLELIIKSFSLIGELSVIVFNNLWLQRGGLIFIRSLRMQQIKMKNKIYCMQYNDYVL